MQRIYVWTRIATYVSLTCGSTTIKALIRNAIVLPVPVGASTIPEAFGFSFIYFKNLSYVTEGLTNLFYYSMLMTFSGTL